MSDYRFLLTKKWLGLAVFVLILIPLFLLASSWQFSRLSDKQVRNAGIAQALAQPVVPIDSIASGRITDDLQWQRVAITGYWQPDNEVLVRRKFVENRVGYWVVTPVASISGTRVLVVRGWIPTGKDALTPPQYSPPPDGKVTIEGRLRTSETRSGMAPTDLPDGQIDVLIPREIDSTALDGFVEYSGQNPADIRTLPSPTFDEGPHWSYAWQWRLFVVLALIGFVVLARSNAQRIRQELAN